MAEEDARFAHLAKDPRFRPNIKHKKVKVDSRFKSMLNDKDFSVKFMDKRGRPVNTATKEDLRRLYEYESEQESDDSDAEEKSEGDSVEESPKEEADDSEKNAQSDSSEEEEEVDSSEEEAEDSGEEESEHDDEVEGGADKEEDDEEDFNDSDIAEIPEDGPDYARGFAMMDSSDEEESSEEEDEEEEEGVLGHTWNEPDHNAPEAEDVTSCLALCNMDWDRIKAKDLYMLFNSFAPQGGAVQSINIFPSEIGKQRMAEEEKLGPREFRQDDTKNDSIKDSKKSVADDGTMGKLDQAKLRRYQLNRLAYYYAIIVCDSKETAMKIYDECDTLEYEKSACRIDLRFVPEGMTFDEAPKDSCTGISDVESFQPSSFTTTAFCQAKVQVTWDETNIERLNRTMKKFTEEDLETDQFDELIASSSGESGEEEEEKTSKKKNKKKNKKKVKDYRKLLGLDDKKSSKRKETVVPFVGGDEDEEEEEQMELMSDVISDEKKKTKSKQKSAKSKKMAPSSTSDDDNDDDDDIDDDDDDDIDDNDDGDESGEEDEDEISFDSDDDIDSEDSDSEKKKKKSDKKLGNKKQKSKSAKDDEEDEEDEEDEDNVEGEMQFTWTPGISKQALKEKSLEKLTPWEKYQQKKKDKKKQKKLRHRQMKLQEQGIEDTTDLGFDDDFFKDEPEEEGKKKKKDRKKKRKKKDAVEEMEDEVDAKEKAALELLMRDENEQRNHFSLQKIMEEESQAKKKKGKKRKQVDDVNTDTFEMKLDQSRFAGLYSDPDMHIDPNAPEFKKTKNMMNLMEHVSKKRRKDRDAL